FYDVATGRCLRTLPAQTGRPTAIAYSPDGSAFAVLRGTDGSASTVLRKAVLTLYQTPDYSVRQTRKISVSVRTQAAIAFTRDGQRLAIAGMLSTQTGNVTKLEDVIEYVPVDAADDNTTMIPVLYGSEARQLLFLDDDTVVVASGLPAEKGWLHRYQADDGKQRGKGIPSWGAVTLTPDGKWLSWIAHGQQLCRQRVTGDPEVLTHRITPLPFHSPVFSRTLDLVAMQDLNSDSVTVLRTRDASDVRTLSFSPAGRLLQTGALAFTADAASLAVKAGHETVIWEMATGMRSRTLRGSDAWNMSLQFSPDGTLLTGVTGDKVLCWEAGTIAELPSVPTIRYTDDYFSSPGFSPLAFSADGSLFATADADKNIVIYRTKDRTPILTITNDRTHFGRIAFSRNGQFLAVALGSGIGVYRVSDGACLQTINRVVPRFLAVSDDGQYLVSTHISQINRWRVKDAVRDYQFDFPANLWIAAMSPDARLFLCKTNENEPPAIQLWQW
ncbi:MAG TPA: WD40 repeat domain-containing protein, partial [Armatimonadota bacterium]|nr:WD40 repeat domain-containing protein [Armatimonadota bacterium]